MEGILGFMLVSNWSEIEDEIHDEVDVGLLVVVLLQGLSVSFQAFKDIGDFKKQGSLSLSSVFS